MKTRILDEHVVDGQSIESTESHTQRSYCSHDYHGQMKYLYYSDICSEKTSVMELNQRM
jgi:hypothetical protein